MLESLSTGSLALLAQAAPDANQHEIPFYETGWFLFLMLVAAVVLGWLIARFITTNLRVNDYRGRMATVLIAVLVALLMIWSKWPPEFGVDLRGGINMVGSLNLEAWRSSDDPNAEPPQAKDIIPPLIQRVNPAGTKEIMIRALGTDKIEVTIPSVNLQEADEIWDRLVKAGKLEFRIVADQEYHPNEIKLAREMAEKGSRETLVQETDNSGNKATVAYWSTLAREVVPEAQRPKEDNPLIPIKYIPQFRHLVRDKATGEILDMGEILAAVGNDEKYASRNFARWCRERGVRTPQILLIQPDPDMNVEGKDLSSVSSDTDEKGRACVAFTTTDAGSSKLGRFTKLNAPDVQGNLRLMGIVLDDQLHSAPSIQEPIYKRGRISGNFTQEEVDELVINLRSGKLDVALNKAPISKDFINSTLGEELKEKGIWAIGASLLLVLVFMLFYYRFAGIVATVALVLNIVLILALIMAIDQPLTLTGLAGLVLTVGMSVDANVLIFERIREEMDRGAALRMAIRNGFDKATTTIVDANVTTLITALVLYVIGTEQIKGFSVTLILGILMSMFTAIFVARLIFDLAERKRWLTKLNMTRILEKNTWSFLDKVSLTSIGSFGLIVLGIGCMYVLGARILDQDLRGGSTVRMVFKEAQDIEQVREELRKQEIVVNDEKVEFSVSGFGVAQGDDEMKDRVFKVDSNLPAWEGKPDDPNKFEELDELLSRLFQGRLMLHEASIEGQSNQQSGSSQDSSSTDETSQSRSRSRDTHRRSVSMVSAISSLTLSQPALLMQDADADTDSKSNDEQPESNSDNSDQDDSSESGGDFAADTGDDDPTGDSGSLSVQYQDVSRNLTVDPEVSGRTLRALIVEASRQVDLELDEEQVKVTTPDVHADESPLTTLSKQWTVTLNVTREADADRILQAWAKNFNNKPYFPTASKVGGQIAGETQLQALAAIIASLIGIIAYIWIRFQNVAFGLAAVVALIHDVLIVLGAIAVSHWLAGSLGILGIEEFKISLEVVAALLTVIGYSLNDTIVVFDRIREVRGKRTEITADMINESISQTLSRTILTSLTTFIVVFILYCFGGDAIHGFAFALTIGVIVGTYSSIFVASPMLLWLMNTCGLNPGIVDPAAE